LGIQFPKTKLECTNGNNNIESRLPNQGFSINFVLIIFSDRVKKDPIPEK